jgi:hypothetical protein
LCYLLYCDTLKEHEFYLCTLEKYGLHMTSGLASHRIARFAPDTWIRKRRKPPVQSAHSSLLLSCPSCLEHQVFYYCGEQQFPEKAAARIGIPTTLYLYTCDGCGSTASHVSLGITQPSR